MLLCCRESGDPVKTSRLLLWNHVVARQLWSEFKVALYEGGLGQSVWEQIFEVEIAE